MKPLNLDNSPCSPISSNCVIWQGPNIPCIKLCTGDTVSDVVFKLATELCEILEQLNVSNYDLACLNIPCPPEDFQTLIQILINKICELENIPVPPPSPDGGPCPTDCIVAVADCLGGGTDTLLNYVNTIADKVCDLVTEISVIQTSITSINVTLVDLQQQIDDIPVYTLPDITAPCTIGTYLTGQFAPLDAMFDAFLGDWCAYISTAATPAELAPVLNPVCTLADNPYFGAIGGLINPAANVADALANIWTSICFLYDFNYKQSIVTGIGDITVTALSDTPSTNITTYEVSLAPTAGIPVGSVMPWAGVGGAPAGWLFCDGTSYVNVAYPDLFAAIGITYGGGAGSFLVPNLISRMPVGQGPNTDGYDLTTLGNTGGARTHTLTDAQIPTHTHGLATATVGGTITAPVSATVTGTAIGTTDGSYANLTTATNNGSTPADDGRIRIAADNNLTTDDHRQQNPHTHTFTGTITGSAIGTATGPFTGTISGNTDDGSSALQGLAHGNMQPYLVMRYIIKY